MEVSLGNSFADCGEKFAAEWVWEWARGWITGTICLGSTAWGREAGRPGFGTRIALFGESTLARRQGTRGVDRGGFIDENTYSAGGDSRPGEPSPGGATAAY